MAVPSMLPPSRSPLLPAAFIALPLGAVKPRGWLLDQLRTQANGLTGHLDELWPDVDANSGWLGGDGEAWERGPYYLDGLLPLAYLLDDSTLKDKAQRWVEWTLGSAQPNGQFGPARNRDWWPRMIMLKVLSMYYESSGDERVLDLMSAYFRYQRLGLKARRLESWAHARGGDNVLSIQWLYNLTGEAILLEVADLILAQTMDWAALQGRYEVGELLPLKEFWMPTHVVNNAMGIKRPAVEYLHTGHERQRHAVRQGIDNLMRHHGQPNGIWSGDEHLNGTSPTSGTELCAVVEYMFSLEECGRILGDPALGDILEQVAYNALPAALTPDMWAHQYDQQVDQVLCSVAKRRWASNGDASNIFGREPNFGCCLANMHQGWPKFVKSLVMATPDKGMAVIAYGPCEARAKVAGDVNATLTIDTAYPFDGEVTMRVDLAAPAKFPLVLRIPHWAEGARLCVNDEAPIGPQAGTFHPLIRRWQDGDAVRLSLPQRIRVTAGHKGLLSVDRGPLLFGLEMGEDFRRIAGDPPFADYEVHPTTPWNYGLTLDLSSVEEAFKVETAPVGKIPFAPDAAPVRLRTRARRLPGWQLEMNSAGDIDVGPHATAAPEEDITLIPYGSTNLRITAFPRAKQRA